MNEVELSKRIDDLHRRFDDLRSDVGRQFTDLRADMNQRFGDLRAEMNQRLEGLNQRLTDMNQRLTDLQGTLRTFMWVVSGWFTFLTAVLAVFGFLRR